MTTEAVGVVAVAVAVDVEEADEVAHVMGMWIELKSMCPAI